MKPMALTVPLLGTNTWVYTPFNCGDNYLCSNEFCMEGICYNEEVDCSDEDDCTDDSCNEELDAAYILLYIVVIMTLVPMIIVLKKKIRIILSISC